MNAIPQRLNAMTHDQKARRIMELEDALQQTNDRIAAAVAAEREACAFVCEEQSRKSAAAQYEISALHCAAAIRARSNGAGRE